MPFETPSATQQQQTLERSPRVAGTIGISLTEMLQQLHEMVEGGRGHKGWSWDRGRGGNLKREEAVETRGLAKGSKAIWVGKWVGRGSRIPGELASLRARST